MRFTWIQTFESFVNSERCKTEHCDILNDNGLRALLIQKDVKRIISVIVGVACLRALLIQKDVKHCTGLYSKTTSLRALLIQKDVKQPMDRERSCLRFESFVNSERCKTVDVLCLQSR